MAFTDREDTWTVTNQKDDIESLAARLAANRRWSKVRSRVEAKFADLKRWCSMDRMRYYGMARNRLWMLICGLACNLKRAGTLAAA